jgi:uncharacterized protein (TIGR02453 family)
MTFTGFPPETFRFLKGLSENNSRAWFDAHRDDYEAFHLAPAKAFVGAIAPGLLGISPTVHAEPRVNGSIFRINRDIRFSKDKRPYKVTLDLWFWDGETRGWETPGFWMRLTPSEFIAGAGMHAFGPAQMKPYRAAVLDERAGKSLERLEETVMPLKLAGATRKAVPRGFVPSHPRARFLLHEGLHATREGPLPPSVHSAAFVDECLQVFRQAAPVTAWLKENL